MPSFAQKAKNLKKIQSSKKIAMQKEHEEEAKKRSDFSEIDCKLNKFDMLKEAYIGSENNKKSTCIKLEQPEFYLNQKQDILVIRNAGEKQIDYESSIIAKQNQQLTDVMMQTLNQFKQQEKETEKEPQENKEGEQVEKQEEQKPEQTEEKQ